MMLTRLHIDLDKVASIFRAIPFIILLAAIAPLTKIIVGKTIGTDAFLVPLALSVFPFFARQVEVVLSELDRGVIEAAQASGATFWDIVLVYLREGLPDLIRVTTFALVSLVGYTHGWSHRSRWFGTSCAILWLLAPP